MMHDSPVQSVDKDLFKRSQFSERLATLIVNRQDSDAIAFGINGAWGEGKTSVLNFICETLARYSPRIIVIKFNPWRFAEESTLLRSFFHTISSDLQKSLTKEELKLGMSDQKRKDDLKRIGNILAEYGDAIGEIPIPFVPMSVFGKAIGTTLKRFSATELDQQKKELSDLLTKYKRKIVVVIDDIDRLSKDEIYSIFRLVKLTADFQHFIYLLAYDEDMVAAAIGSRFGDGGKEAGKQFLEKIVQIPITLPQASIVDLSLFFAQSFEKILSENKLLLSAEDASRFRSVFNTTLLFHLDTPRKIIRYCNALQFSLPLLYGEVNFVDLIIIEGIKIFYPKHFDFIKDNSQLFTDNALRGVAMEYDKAKAKVLNDAMRSLNTGLSDRDTGIIKSLIMELFPTIESVWNNKVHSSSAVKAWTTSKQIVSRNYFNRYFTYTLSKDDISDRAFEQFVKGLKAEDVNEGSKRILEFTTQYSAGIIIQKLRLIEKTFTPEESARIAKSICAVSQTIPRYDGFMSFVVSPFVQATFLVARLVGNIVEESDRLALVQELLVTPDIQFAFELYRSIKSLNKDGRLISDTQWLELERTLLDRCTQSAGGKPFFVQFPTEANDLLRIWSRIDQAHLNQHLKSLFEEQPALLGKFLYTIVGDVTTLGSDKVNKGDLTKEAYEFLKSKIDTEMLSCLIKKQHPDLAINDVILSTISDGVPQTPENAIKQFLYWHGAEH